MKLSKKEEVYKDLKQRVLTLDLPPGHPLDEALLSEQYELSRTPLREVLQRIAGEGYINLEAHRSATVSSMDLAVMRSFFQSAPMIYAAIARLATEQATSSQIAELKKIQTGFRKSVQKNLASDMSMLNHQFHEQLGVMANTPYLTPSLGRLLVDHTRMSHRFYRARQPSSRKRIDDACTQHDEMIQAIEEHAPAKTVELTIAHWELSRSEMDKYVMPDSLPMDGIEDTNQRSTHEI
jgi:DNA-binding GntR family transcriptional regulator